MPQRTSIGFGLLIAYILPGFTLLLALSLLAEPVQVWLLGPATAAPAVGGVLYVTAASVLLGKLLNALRWALLDTLFQRIGPKRPSWDERRLPQHLAAFERLVEDHYRYYQFYGNLAIALPLCLLIFRLSPHTTMLTPGPLEAAAVLFEILLIAASRDALRRYFSRTATLLGKDPAMTNGSHPKTTKPTNAKPTPKKDGETKTQKADKK